MTLNDLILKLLLAQEARGGRTVSLFAMTPEEIRRETTEAEALARRLFEALPGDGRGAAKA